MYYFSNSTDMSFEEAVALTRDALKRHHLFMLQQVIDSISPARVPTALGRRPRGRPSVSTRVAITADQNAQKRSDLPAA